MKQIRLTKEDYNKTIMEIAARLQSVKASTADFSFKIKMPTVQADKATLRILPAAWRKIQALVDLVSTEVAWHGTVTKQGNIYTIEDVFVFPQKVTGATVTTDETEYSMWLAQQSNEVFNKLRFHGHSHVHMGVNPSGVDITYQENILKNLQDFYIFAIFNKDEKNYVTIYDVQDNIIYDDNDIILETDTEIEVWATTQINAQIKSQTYTPTTGAGYYQNSFYAQGAATSEQKSPTVDTTKETSYPINKGGKGGKGKNKKNIETPGTRYTHETKRHAQEYLDSLRTESETPEEKRQRELQEMYARYDYAMQGDD